MSNAYLCCDSCFEAIGKRNAKAAKLWVDLCSIYSFEEGAFDVIIDDELILRQLEVLGFIVTTDRGPFITIKVLGLSSDEEDLQSLPSA